MIQNSLSFLANVIHNLRFADIIDIIIVSIFLYIFFSWLRREASHRLMINISLLIILYILSRIFDLYLTEIIIKILMVLIVIASVVVFQSDIRRVVDLIGSWSIFKGSSNTPQSENAIDILTEACFKMAENRTGALIAVKGREPWDRAVHGGMELNGKVSQPLLFSIFNTKSPGHDGAVLIEGERILKFGAHLTLSTNLSKVGAGGTRHAAALGLSEQSDAFIIVVSEERGIVSIAHKGKLSRTNSGSELKNRLRVFWNEHYSSNNLSIVNWWKNKRIMTAALSFSCAVILWFLFGYQADMVYRNYKVPVEFKNLNPDLGIVEARPMEVRVSLSGSEQAFRLFNSASLAASFDLKNISKGTNSFEVTEDNLDLPSNIRLYEADPHIVKISVRQLKTISVPVKLNLKGKLKKPHKIGQIKINPPDIRLIIPESGKEPDKIYTEELNLDKLGTTSSYRLKLIIPPGVKLPSDQDDYVNVKIGVK
jgi:uncharacterized protein (TIGR00159 family)